MLRCYAGILVFYFRIVSDIFSGELYVKIFRYNFRHELKACRFELQLHYGF